MQRLLQGLDAAQQLPLPFGNGGLEPDGPGKLQGLARKLQGNLPLGDDLRRRREPLADGLSLLARDRSRDRRLDGLADLEKLLKGQDALPFFPLPLLAILLEDAGRDGEHPLPEKAEEAPSLDGHDGDHHGVVAQARSREPHGLRVVFGIEGNLLNESHHSTIPIDFKDTP